MQSQIHPDILHYVSKTCSPEWSHNDKLEKYHLQFIDKGSADYNVDGASFNAKEGEVVFIKPGSTRRATTPGMSCIVFDFLLPDGEDIDLPLIFPLSSFDEFRLYFQDLQDEWLQRNPGFKLKSQAILMMILYKLLYERDKREKNNHVELMKQFILKKFSEKLTVKMVSNEVGLNTVYCGALFKKIEGCTISEFITRVRINRAISLLESGESNISEIAEATGFMDIYFFSNTFKRVVGVAPSMYKNRQKDI